MKILFVDDELEVESLATVLQNRHPEDQLKLVDNLAAAKKTIWSEKFDVMVLDLMMPADDEAVPNSSHDAGLTAGLLLAELIQQDKNCVNNQTPFIVLTGLVPQIDERVAEARSKYGDRFIEKPVHPDALYEVIQNAKKSS
jgi:CheY-like chemotaxis protein